MTDAPSCAEFGASFKQFIDRVNAQAPAEEPFFRQKLCEHFGADPTTLTTTRESFASSDQANVQLAIDHWVDGLTGGCDVVGIAPSEHSRYTGLHFTDLLTRGRLGHVSEPGPLQRTNVAVGLDAVLACADAALYLALEGDEPVAVLQTAGEFGWRGRTIEIEAMTRSREGGMEFFSALRDAMRRRNVYRGHVISLSETRDRSVAVRFHRLPSVGRDDIILPPGVLERIERNAIQFSVQRDRLRAAGRHLKRGILLYGPPGTGKTLTAMHLASRMHQRTVLLLTGRGQGLLEEACAMARTLDPSTLILEDVDLIAEERTRQSQCSNTLLFELLNQMDGLGDDADVLFLLTTNRPELLEPALAARPGRIDLAVEVPLPDANCRHRLFELYGKGLTLDADMGRLVARTEGVSAAFIRELLRLATVLSAESGPELVVVDRHLDQALRELILEGGPLMRRLLGGDAHETGAP